MFRHFLSISVTMPISTTSAVITQPSRAIRWVAETAPNENNPHARAGVRACFTIALLSYRRKELFNPSAATIR